VDQHPITERIAVRLADGARQPVTHLIVDDIWLAVVAGDLASGERLPTPRQLAISLGVTPRAVERAYEELESRGVVATRPGEGTFISLGPTSQEEHARRRELTALCQETIGRAAHLGFDLDQLMDALADFRTLESHTATEETTP
jgi:GntR family transcriptional regulator